MTQALLVIDIQNDYFPGGKMELVGSEAAGKVAGQIQSLFRSRNQPVINVQHVARSQSATFFLPDTNGVEIHSLVVPIPGEEVVIKHFPNSFRETNLLELLNQLNISELTIVGMMTHMCVDTTVRAANDLGFKVTLIADACATADLSFDGKVTKAAEVQTAYLAAIDGSFGDVIHSSKIL